MTSPIPTITVLLDDGTGTYPTDVTSRVSLSSGVTVNGHGRNDEFSQATAATFNCTLKNNDGALSSTGAISIYPGQGIRYKQHFGSTTVNRFTGRISELGLGWEGGVAKASSVPVTAVDLLSELSLRPVRSFLEYEWLLFSPTAYYTCGEAVGSVSAGDSSGNGAPALVSTGSGAAPTFGAVSGMLEGTGIDFNGGKYLSAPGYLPTAGFALLVTFNRASAPGSLEILAMFGDTFLALETSGKVSVYRGGGLSVLVTQTGTTRCDGATYTVGFAVKPGVGYDFMDLFSVSSVVDATANLGSSQPLSVGGAGAASTNATISHVVLLTSMPTTFQLVSVSNVVAGVGSTPATQAHHIASTYNGYTLDFTNASGALGSGALMPVPAVTGGSILDALVMCVTTENGVLFVDGTGTIQFQGRNYRTLKTTPTLTVAAKDVDAGTTIPWDTQQIVNSSTVTRVGGSAQTYVDPVSTAARGVFPQSTEIVVSDDASALYAAEWEVNKHSSSIPRIGAATVRVLTSSQAEQLIQAEIGDRWSISGMPSQNWSTFGDLTVEGWSETLVVTDSSADWSLTVNLLPWQLFQAWILGDTTYSVLGSTTIPAY